jgi:hypothetical protein
VKSFGFQCRTATRASTGAMSTPTWTITTTIAAIATGAAECIMMQIGQWSASLSLVCRCVTCVTASKARRIRQTMVTAGRALMRPRRFVVHFVPNPGNRFPSLP